MFDFLPKQQTSHAKMTCFFTPNIWSFTGFTHIIHFLLHRSEPWNRDTYQVWWIWIFLCCRTYVWWGVLLPWGFPLTTSMLDKSNQLFLIRIHFCSNHLQFDQIGNHEDCTNCFRRFRKIKSWGFWFSILPFPMSVLFL